MGTYLSHQLGEVGRVSGWQPEEGANAGVQRRAVAHDEGDAHCRKQNSLRSKQARSGPLIRPRVRKAVGVKLAHGVPEPPQAPGQEEDVVGNCSEALAVTLGKYSLVLAALPVAVCGSPARMASQAGGLGAGVVRDGGSTCPWASFMMGPALL